MRLIVTSICTLFIFTLAGCKPGVYYNPKTTTTYNAQGQIIEKPKPAVGQPLVNLSDPNR